MIEFLIMIGRLRKSLCADAVNHVADMPKIEIKQANAFFFLNNALDS